MQTLRPFLGILLLSALLAARAMPDLAGELVLSAATVPCAGWDAPARP